LTQYNELFELFTKLKEEVDNGGGGGGGSGEGGRGREPETQQFIIQGNMAGDCCGCEDTCGAPSYLCTLRKEAPKRAVKKDYGKSKGFGSEELKKVIKQLNALKIRVDGFSFDATLGERINNLDIRLT
jgi:hypothetical protein